MSGADLPTKPTMLFLHGVGGFDQDSHWRGALEQSLEWIGKIAPKRAVLTHMHIPLDYETVMAETPSHVEPAYDGLVIEHPAV